MQHKYKSYSTKFGPLRVDEDKLGNFGWTTARRYNVDIHNTTNPGLFIFTTAKELDHNAKKFFAGSVRCVGRKNLEGWVDDNHNFWDAFRKLTLNTPPVTSASESKVLRGHQEEALVKMAVDKGIILLPTGSGKSLVIFRDLIRALSKQTKPSTYVIISPKILLNLQLLEDCFEELCHAGLLTTARLSLVCSDKNGGFTGEIARQRNLAIPDDARYRIESTTNAKRIAGIVAGNTAKGRSTVFVSTYKSADELIKSGVDINTIYYDEAHHLATEDYSVLAEIKSTRKYYFTATMKVSGVDESLLGMNNTARFGDVLYKKTPKELIEAGEIVKPLLGWARVTDPIMSNGEKDENLRNAADVHIIVDAFEALSAELQKGRKPVGAKLLVACRGTDHLNAIKEQVIRELRKKHPNLKDYDITSRDGAYINGEWQERPYFLEDLKSLKSDDNTEAIVFHVDILTEGIDVSVFSAVLPYRAYSETT